MVSAFASFVPRRGERTGLVNTVHLSKNCS
jgi:hypothetical protein